LFAALALGGLADVVWAQGGMVIGWEHVAAAAFGVGVLAGRGNRRLEGGSWRWNGIVRCQRRRATGGREVRRYPHPRMFFASF
jgi:hypothetical protein